MTDYERGFRAGVEAAAKWIDDHTGGGDLMFPGGIVAQDAIRSLSPPSPEPATRCLCGQTVSDRNAGGIWVWPRGHAGYLTEGGCRPAPAPGPESAPACDECSGTGKVMVACPDHKPGCLVAHYRPCPECQPAPAPGPERCGHESWARLSTPHGPVRLCGDCGAEWRDDGQGWRGGRS